MSSSQNKPSVVFELVQLHPFEYELLLSLRDKWRFGEVTIVMRDGLPVRIRRVLEVEDLTGGDNPERRTSQ